MGINMKVFENAFSKVYLFRAQSYYDSILKKELSRLEKSNRLKQFPAFCTEPMIYGSRFHRKKDRGWQDFFFSLSGTPTPDYIPPSIFYPVMEPVLNNRLMVRTIKDKNFYDLFYPEICTPSTPLRRINGFLYDENYQQADVNDNFLDTVLSPYDKLILKPSMDSGSGSGIFLFIRDGSVLKSDGTVLNAAYIKSLEFDFVAQAYIEQHDYFSALNPTSSNTLRLLIYRSFQDDSVNVLSGLLRIGGKDSFMDHDNLGGVSIAINQTGIVGDIAFDVNGNRYEQFNGVRIKDIGPIPQYDEFVAMANVIAAKSHYGRLLGLDFTMDSSGQVMLLDINCWRNGINHFQFCHGTLFGRFTSEIIDYCNQAESFNVIRVPLL